MQSLTFGEQVKIILGRKGMTIKELAEIIEERTGKKMSRQNLTQRLGRDNFQEQDMRMIAGILGCPFYLSIMESDVHAEQAKPQEQTARLQEYKDKVHENVTYVPPVSEPSAVPVSPAASSTSHSSVKMEKEWRLVEMRRQQKAAEKARREEERLEQERLEQERLEQERIQKEEEKLRQQNIAEDADEVDMTIGELYQMHEQLDELEEAKAVRKQQEMKEKQARQQQIQHSSGTVFLRKNGKPVEQPSQRSQQGRENAPRQAEERRPAGERHPSKRPASVQQQSGHTASGRPVQQETRRPAQPLTSTEERIAKRKAQDSKDFEPVIKYKDEPENLQLGELNPYTGHEYQSNSVRMHPNRIGYVQVYDRKNHKWTDMTEWAFLGFQERKKKLLGKDYDPPIYLD